ncbi:hypothetical protein PHET_09418 [Paragonimus heterotremus]|uniref:GLE1 RNA export mediator n=1 Tax=Paragonimus heterotremus TaxID=100268 RepID=A0A8J4SK91_9TREM|nr:hypothetical protein PHET_09418 [Paragonimus heterotremus]
MIDLDSAWHETILVENAAAKIYEHNLKRSRRLIRSCLDNSAIRLRTISQRLLSDPEDVIIETRQNHPCTVPQGNAVVAQVESSLDRRPDMFYNLVDKICILRSKLYERVRVSECSPAQWTSLVEEIEHIESRALTVLSLPSPFGLDQSPDEHAQQIHLALKHLESQAVDCLERAKKVVPIDRSSKSQSARPTAVASDPKKVYLTTLHKPFPTIEDARKLVEHSTDLLHPLLSDYKLRQQTLQVKRTVSCACSQITRHDPVHCLDRTRYLMAFLSGEPVKISGVSTGKQNSDEMTLSQMLPGDLGSTYAWQCLFSATLSQAEHQFAHNLEIAVTFASVLSGILSQHPDRIPEFFARIFIVCPILCAFTDDTACSLARTMLESSDLLARWRGTARLFAALLIAQPPSPLRLKRPPHLNPALLWRVIAGMVNKPFVPCATAEVILPIVIYFPIKTDYE